MKNVSQILVAVMAYQDLLNGKNPFGLPARTPCNPGGLSMWERIELRDEYERGQK